MRIKHVSVDCGELGRWAPSIDELRKFVDGLSPQLRFSPQSVHERLRLLLGARAESVILNAGVQDETEVAVLSVLDIQMRNEPDALAEALKGIDFPLSDSLVRIDIPAVLDDICVIDGKNTGKGEAVIPLIFNDVSMLKGGSELDARVKGCYGVQAKCYHNTKSGKKYSAARSGRIEGALRALEASDIMQFIRRPLHEGGMGILGDFNVGKFKQPASVFEREANLMHRYATIELEHAARAFEIELNDSFRTSPYFRDTHFFVFQEKDKKGWFLLIAPSRLVFFESISQDSAKQCHTPDRYLNAVMKSTREEAKSVEQENARVERILTIERRRKEKEMARLQQAAEKAAEADRKREKETNYVIDAWQRCSSVREVAAMLSLSESAVRTRKKRLEALGHVFKRMERTRGKKSPAASPKSVGIIAGSFKPLHRGHFYLIERAASENDEVRVFVSLSDRGPIMGLVMHRVWTDALMRALPQNVNVEFTSGSSPIRRVYEFLGVANDDAASSDVFTLYSDPDDLERRFPEDRRLKYLERLESSGRLRLCAVKREAELDVSATRLRELLSQGAREEFMEFLPNAVDKGAVWNMLVDDGERP